MTLQTSLMKKIVSLYLNVPFNTIYINTDITGVFIRRRLSSGKSIVRTDLDGRLMATGKRDISGMRDMINACMYGRKETKSGDQIWFNCEYHNPNIVIIWGCICRNGLGTLVAVEGNINATKYQEILDEHLWPAIAWHFSGGDYFFQDDKAPVHHERSIQDFVVQNGINCMSWQAVSKH